MTTETAAHAVDDLLREVLDRQDGAPDRLRGELLRGAVRHLHAYVREARLDARGVDGRDQVPHLDRADLR